MSKVDELIRFLEFSFQNKKDNFAILFELFTDNLNDITRTISIKINGKDLSITDKKEGKYDSQVIIKEEAFINLYSGGLSAFQLFKLLFKSKDIQTTNLSINKFRKFISKFNFSSDTWNAFYNQQK